MTPQHTPNWNPEPFPEPRTFPEGWVNDTFSPEKSAPEGAEDTWKPEPFPEPRTFPWAAE